MKVFVLASGSTGNALCLQAGETNILIDAGLSARKITAALDTIGVDTGRLDGMLITHEHHDHIKGVASLARRYNLPVYAREKTWRALEQWGVTLPEQNRRVFTTEIEIGELKIEPFSLSHDAVDPVGYCAYHRAVKFALATDLGHVSPAVKQALTGSDIFVLESNHDPDMLWQGSYPWFLKRRIASDRGHLSNIAAGKALAECVGGNRPRVLLGHLSRENNRPPLAARTVARILADAGLKLGEDVRLKLTYPDRISSWQISEA